MEGGTRATTGDLIRAGRAWCLAAAAAASFSLRSAAPRSCRVLERLLARCGRAGVAAATIAAAAFPFAVAGAKIAQDAVERGHYLSYPWHWDPDWHPAPVAVASSRAADVSEGGVGGMSDAVLPLRIMTYTARPGDTLSGIAQAFGLELDTVSSLNRTWGNGVHAVSIGERIRVPNQNGIFLTVKGSLDALCRENDVLPEAVLGANGLQAADVRPGSALFFPGVQHRGAEKELVAGTAFFYPVAGWVSSGYGLRSDPFTPGLRKAHYGTDLAAPLGTPVRAARSGTVWYTGEDAVFGKQVLIGHDFGYSTFYGHLGSVTVRPGQQVSYQTVIGTVGATGRATGPHLHFEIRSGGAAINPAARLAPRRY